MQRFRLLMVCVLACVGLFLQACKDDPLPPGSAPRLVFTTQPAWTYAGELLQPVVVELQDGQGQRLTGSTDTVTLALESQTESLAGTLSVQAVEGRATFSTLRVMSGGRGFVLGATAAGLEAARSQAFDVKALRLHFDTQPSHSLVGDVLALQVSLRGDDGQVVPVARPITLALTGTPGGEPLQGNLTQNSVNGVATFTGILVPGVGTGYRLLATAAAAAPANSAAFDVEALHLTFVGTPQLLLAGQPLPGFSVRLTNGQGARLVGVSRTVSLSLGSNPSGATLSGTLSGSTTEGEVHFTGVSLDRPGEGYTLVASSPGAQVTSTPFTLAYSVDELEPEDKSTPGARTNDTPATAEPLVADIPVFGSLKAAGEVDHFKFRARAGELLEVATYATRLEQAQWKGGVRVRLLDTDGTTSLYHMGFDGLGWAVLDYGLKQVRIPADGEYFLAFEPDCEDTVAGARYAALIKLRPPPPLSQETELESQLGLNDSRANAQPLSPGILFGFYLTPGITPADSDYYRISIGAPSRVRIGLIAQRNGVYRDSSVALDPVLELQDASGDLNSAGTVLWSSDDASFYDSAIDYPVTTPGVYYVRVTRHGGEGSAPYFLTYEAQPLTSIVETTPNNTPELAMPVSFGQEVTGALAGSEPHYFRFQGSAGELVRLVLSDGRELDGSPGPVDATFLDATGNTLLVAGRNLAGGVEYRQTILQAGGSYLVRVQGSAGRSFTFRLERVASASHEVEPNDAPLSPGSAPQASPVGPHGWATGVIQAAGDRDTFSLQAAAGQLVSIALHAAHRDNGEPSGSHWGSMLMPVLEVFNRQGTLLAKTVISPGPGQGSAISVVRGLPMMEVSFRAPASGEYFVVVSDTDSTAGGANRVYALEVLKNQ